MRWKGKLNKKGNKEETYCGNHEFFQGGFLQSVSSKTQACKPCEGRYCSANASTIGVIPFRTESFFSPKRPKEIQIARFYISFRPECVLLKVARSNRHIKKGVKTCNKVKVPFMRRHFRNRKHTKIKETRKKKTGVYFVTTPHTYSLMECPVSI